MGVPYEAKCTDKQLNCLGFLEPCTASSQVCKDSVDKVVAQLEGAADCAAAEALEFEIICQ
jgi:hypothetical protein